MAIAVTDRAHRLKDAWCRHQSGDLSYAYRTYLQLLSEKPDDAKALHYLGLLAHQTGHSHKGIELLTRSLACAEDARAFDHLGQIYASRFQLDEAARCFRNAIRLDPTSAATLNNLANVLRKQRLSRDAADAYREAIALDPRSREAHYNLGKLLVDEHLFSDALHHFERAIEIDPKNHLAHYELALCLEELGEFERAINHYRSALVAKPDHARSLANLLALTSYEPNEAMVTQAKQLARDDRSGTEARAKLHQGLGKYHDRNGAVDLAFFHFQQSNRIQRQWHKVGANAPATTSDTVIARYSPAYFATVQGLGNPSERPVFVVGMPRSGTTLVEQILASHPMVWGAGELMDIPSLAANEPATDADSLRQAAHKYLMKLTAAAPETAMRVIDKLPMNFRHLGLIAALLPKARIVYCRRDPRDVALSCFIEMFSMRDLDFTDLESIAHAIVDHHRLMQHWQSVLPIAIHVVDYEALVAETEAQIRDLLAYCGLAWNDRCLRFFDTPRRVDTPSRWQVRQPIYRSSLNRWRRYSHHLRPATSILEAAGLLPPEAG